MKITILAVSAAFATVLLSSCASYHSAGAQVASSLEVAGEATTHAISYGADSTHSDSESDPVLDGVVKFLKDNPTAHLEIQSGTNNSDDAAFNPALSQARTNAIKAYFVVAGIDANRLDATN
jgi:outer membrane protein OmpA-like peptidoglycan-associated protein